MKKVLLFILLATLWLSCSKKSQIDSIYNKYERELIQGNTIKAEGYLDDIIKIDQNNPKYLKLKIPLLVNDCKKAEAIKLIDKVLIGNKNDIDLVILKILLIPNTKQKQELLEKMNLLLEEKMKEKATQREHIIANLILVKKIQNTDQSDIIKIFEKFNLTKDEEIIFRDNVSLSLAEISSMIPRCK